MRVTVTGATGLIGARVVGALRERADEVTVLSRDPDAAVERLERSAKPSPAALAAEDLSPDTGRSHRMDRSVGASRGLSAGGDLGTGQGPGADDAGSLRALGWDPVREPAPAAALRGRDAVVHLAGENVAQRWSARAKRAIRDSRVAGTRNLVQAIAALADEERPRTLVSGSAIGYYGAHRDEPIDEDTPPGGDFLAQTCVAWEAEAVAAERIGLRVVRVRTGVVLDRAGGALAKMLTPFKLGIGGPMAGGDQYVSWIHLDDLVEILLVAIDDERWSGPVNATAPQPERNRDFSKTLGRVLGRPAALPVPALGLRLLYGEMAKVVTDGARVLPAQALVLGFEFRYPQLEPALRAALAAG